MTKAALQNFLGALLEGAAFVNPEQLGRVESSLDHAYAIMTEKGLTLGRPRASKATGAADPYWRGDQDSWRPYAVEDGILTIPIQGVLLGGFSYQLGSYATGYEYIAKAMERGLGDSEVKGIALLVDSPGGSVSGLFETVDQIYEGRQEKPIRAFVEESSFSAAYALSSAADDITISRSAGTGSIGVVTMHVDYSKALEKEGIKVSLIYAGKHKVDFSSYKPLSDQAEKKMQARVDELYGVFCASVARNRDLTDKAVRATEADCFNAQESIDNGLADTIGNIDTAMADFASQVQPGALTMAAAATTSSTVTQADHDAALAAAKTQMETAKAEATKAERARIQAIMGCDEAKDRPAFAKHLAMNTDLTLEGAKGMLAAAAVETGAAKKEDGKAAVADDPKAKAAAAADKNFKAAMAAQNPELAATGEGEEGDGSTGTKADSPQAKANSILNDYAAQGGRVRQPEKRAS